MKKIIQNIKENPIGFGLLIIFLVLPLLLRNTQNIQWLIVPFAAFFLFWSEKRGRSLKNVKLAILMGIFLSVFDWVIENLGAIYGFWVSNFSNFYILAVPLEVSVGAVFTGAALSLILIKSNPSFKNIIIGSAVFALLMTLGEYYANVVGLMRYGNGWWQPHAFLAYFGTWLMFFYLNKYITKKAS